MFRCRIDNQSHKHVELLKTVEAAQEWHSEWCRKPYRKATRLYDKFGWLRLVGRYLRPIISSVQLIRADAPNVNAAISRIIRTRLDRLYAADLDHDAIDGLKPGFR